MLYRGIRMRRFAVFPGATVVPDASCKNIVNRVAFDYLNRPGGSPRFVQNDRS
jgi:hypothetical protein